MYTYKKLIPEELRPIGKCDFCESENRYLSELRDGFGFHVMSKCLYGCSDPKSILDEKREAFKVGFLKKTYESKFHDSKWMVGIQIKEQRIVIPLIRFNSEDEESLLAEILKCKNRNEIARLNQCVFYN